MSHTFEQLKAADGSWDSLIAAWKDECEKFDEEFEGYASAAIPMLGDLAGKNDASYSVYGLKNDETNTIDAVCSVNWTHIPGYQDKVLRVRNLLFAPKFDFGEFEVFDYAMVLTRVFARATNLALDTMPSRHIKFHLRSPVERQFFALAGADLGALDEFKSVKVRGSWLYVDLA